MIPTKKYNIGFLSDDEIISLFCVRTNEMDMIMETVGENQHASNQHVLVIGPRGSGKSTLLLRCAAEMRQDPVLKENWLPVIFMEESYEVGSIGEFWLECLFQIIQQAPEPEKQKLQPAYDELLLELDDETLSLKARARILDFADQKQKRLALVVENLNTLFEEMPSKQQDETGWKLRHTLQNEPRIMLMASATSRFDQIDHSDKALFDLFRTLTLKPLTTAECSLLWQGSSQTTQSKGTIRAIEILTGGSPRLISIVARFGANLSLNTLLNELLDLVDDHTEYFKSHLESLPPKERRVYLALADLWIPATAKEIATRARQNIRSCSALLNRLISRGVVVEDETSKPRRKRYYLNERMYNIYYLLRRRRKPDAMATALLRFMAALYPEEQLLKIGHTLVSDCTQTDKEPAVVAFHVFSGLYNQLKKGKDTLLNKTPWSFIEQLPDQETASVMVARKATKRLKQVQKFYEKKQFQRVIDELKPTISQIKELDHSITELGLSALLHYYSLALEGIGNHEKTIACYDEILIKFRDSKDNFTQNIIAKAYKSKGDVLGKLGRLDQAIACLDEVQELFKGTQNLGIKETIAEAILFKGIILEVKGNIEDAITCFKKAGKKYARIESQRDQIFIKIRLARLLQIVGKETESLGHIKDLINRWTDTIKDHQLILLIDVLIEYISETNSEQQILDLIMESKAAQALHPLVVALQLELGQEVRVAVEVKEVANDIRKRMDKMRETQNKPI